MYCPEATSTNRLGEVLLVPRRKSKTPLQCPTESKTQDAGAGYRSLGNNLQEFSELGELDEERLDENDGIVATRINNRAKWHKLCQMKYNNMKLQRVKRKLSEEPGSSAATPPKRTRSNVSCVDSSHYRCFFCYLDLGSEYHQATTLELDQRVRQSAEFLEDTTLLAQLSTGDMVAIEAKYHNRCLVSLYNQVRANMDIVSSNSRLYKYKNFTLNSPSNTDSLDSPQQ